MPEKTLVILHGWGDSAASWQHVEQFVPGWRIVPIDMPGFGKEPLVADDWGVPEYAAWVQNRIVSLRISNCILLGHSFGGRVASLLASQRPTWLRGAILYAAPSIYRPSRNVRLKRFFARIVKRTSISTGILKSEELRSADASGMGSIFRNIVGFDQTNALKNITIPCLIVWGTHDTIVPHSLGKKMHELIPQSQLALLDDLGHYAHTENPTLFYGTVTRFLANL